MIANMQPSQGERAVEGWVTHLSAAGRSINTIKSRTTYIRQAFAVVDPDTATTSELESWLVAHPQWSVETTRAAIAALRGFFEWYHATGHRADDPAAALVPPRQPDPDPHPTPRGVLQAAMASADARTRTLLRLLSTTGLRRAEAARVHTDDLDGEWLTVYGKGRRVRRVPVPPDVADAIRNAHGWLFPGRSGGHVDPWWISTTVKRATGYSAHSLRHLYATTVWRATGDLLAVQRLLGHASPKTTERYVLVDADRIAGAASAAWAA